MREAIGKTNTRPSRRATAATELALTLPLLIALTLAGVDFGRVAYVSLTVSNAARAGAEYGATHQFTEFTKTFWLSQVRQAVTDEMANLPGFDVDRLTVEPRIGESGDPADMITVEVRYPFDAIVHWPGLPGDFVVCRRVTMRQVR